MQKIGAQDIPRPEALLLDAQGFLISGLHDGRIIRTAPDSRSLEVLAHTGGRPLGMALHPDGRWIIADAIKGLLTLDSQRQLTTLSTAAANVPLGFTNDVAIDATGRYAYFSDTSSRWRYGQDGEAVIEHGAPAAGTGLGAINSNRAYKHAACMPWGLTLQHLKPCCC